MDGLVDARRLVLGTAQWGMSYGIANRTGRPDREELSRLLARAERAGVRAVDTARAYGDSERVIGSLLRARGAAAWDVTTKLAADLGPETRDAREARARAAASLDASRRALGWRRLGVVLLHRAAQRHAFGGAIWSLLRDERRAGRIGRLGVSAANPGEAEAALADPEVEVVQVATSLLDQRLLRSGFFARARARHRQVDVRSVFLQGVAHLAPESLPEALAPLAEPLERIAAWAEPRGFEPAEAFLAFARELPGVRLVVGCESAAQLEQDLRWWRRRAPSRADLDALRACVPPLDDDLLDPSRWPTATSRRSPRSAA